MTRADADFEVLFESPAGRLVRFRDVFIQVRWGVLTVLALDRMREAFRAATRSSSARMFGIFVVEPDADVPSAEVRARQKEVLADVGVGERMFGVVVIEGQGVLAHLGRSNMAARSPEALVVADAGEAARVIARERGTNDADDIVKAITSARRRDRVGPPP